MSLGIYDRLWELLEGACTELDMLLAKHMSTSGAGGLGNSFDEYVAALRKREQLSEKIATCQQRASVLDQLVTCLSLHTPKAAQNPHLKVMREAASKAHLEVDAVVKCIKKKASHNYLPRYRIEKSKPRRHFLRNPSHPGMGLILNPFRRVLTNSMFKGRPIMEVLL